MTHKPLLPFLLLSLFAKAQDQEYPTRIVLTKTNGDMIHHTPAIVSYALTKNSWKPLLIGAFTLCSPSV